MAKRDLTDLLVGYKSEPDSRPAHSESPLTPSHPPGVWIVVSVTGLLLGAILTYFVYALNAQQEAQFQSFQAYSEEVGQALELIEKRLDGDADQIATLGSQMQVTMDRVGVTQRELGRARALAQQLKEEQQRNVATLKQDLQRKADVQKLASLELQSGQKFEGVDREITDVKADVKSTRQELFDTMAELSDLGVKVNEQGRMIATNQTGLEELRRRGERDYLTFELKKKVRTRVAGITLELLDTDPSPLDADIRIYANDTVMERKDTPQNTAVNFYVGAERIPYELVLNEITNKPDTCKGYISIPKGKLPTGPPELSSASR